LLGELNDTKTLNDEYLKEINELKNQIFKQNETFDIERINLQKNLLESKTQNEIEIKSLK